MKLYGLIGYPLDHSFSKKYFSEKFKREGLDGCGYELFPIDSIKKLPELLQDYPLLAGLNVTVPYKQQVLDFITDAASEVRDIGAANTIKINNGKLTAYNTDVIGFERSLKKKLTPHHKKALVLGTGGSSKAVQYVLKKLQIDFLVVSRKENEAMTIQYDALNEELIDKHMLIINCTPVGMYPGVNEYPHLPYRFISSKHYLFDLVYNPEKSLFLKKGEEKGAVIQNGYEMLVIQAEESWKIWNS